MPDPELRAEGRTVAFQGGTGAIQACDRDSCLDEGRSVGRVVDQIVGQIVGRIVCQSVDQIVDRRWD